MSVEITAEEVKEENVIICKPRKKRRQRKPRKRKNDTVTLQ